MSDIAEVFSTFQGATKEQVHEALGQATFRGIDKYGMDVISYEFGEVPESQEGGKRHLTFVFENDSVVSVLGNSMILLK